MNGTIEGINAELWTLAGLRHCILEGLPTCFTRWGDGEWACLFGAQGKNCDGHKYSLPLQMRLMDALKRQTQCQTMRLGMQPLALNGPLRKQIVSVLSQERFNNLTWCDADLLHDAAVDGSLRHLIQDLRRVPTLIVGPGHLERFARDLDAYFCEIPSKNCFDSYATWSHSAAMQAERLPAGGVVSVSASLPAALLIEALWHLPLIVFDAGSVWDPFVGVNSRRYHRKYDVKRINGYRASL